MIIFVSGMPRSGKTLLISILGLLMGDAGFQVYSNYSLEGAKDLSVYDFVSHIKDAEPQEEPVFYCLHEVYSWFSSHKSFSDVNEIAAVFLCQAEKLNRHFFVDSQISRKVDNNFRILATKRLEAEKQETRFVYHELDIEFPDQDIRTGAAFSVPVSFASDYWNRYSSWSRNMPLGFTSLLVKLQKLEPKLMNETINNQVSLLRNSVRRFSSQISVEDFLLQNNESIAFSKYVWSRYKG